MADAETMAETTEEQTTVEEGNEVRENEEMPIAKDPQQEEEIENKEADETAPEENGTEEKEEEMETDSEKVAEETVKEEVKEESMDQSEAVNEDEQKNGEEKPLETTDENTKENIDKDESNSKADDTKEIESTNTEVDGTKQENGAESLDTTEDNITGIEETPVTEDKQATGKKRGPKKKKKAAPELKTPKRPANVVEDADDDTPEGWTRIVVQRTTGASAGKFDVYYYSPLGKKLRSKNEVRTYCEENNLSLDMDRIRFSQKAPGANVRIARATSATPKTPKGASPKTPKTPKSEPARKRKVGAKSEGKGRGSKATNRGRVGTRVSDRVAGAQAKAAKDSGKLTVKFSFNRKRGTKSTGQTAKRTRRTINEENKRR